MTRDMGAVLRGYYDSPGVAAAYGERESCFAAETVVFDALRAELAGARVLDLGVGQGRTIPHLRDRCRHWVGLDFSARMLAACRARYGSDGLLRGDGRGLPFPDGAFGGVCFTFNGLDDVSHGDRLRILAEVHRVLRPGGFFLFSSHNRDNAPPSPYRMPPLARGRGLLGNLRGSAAGWRATLEGIANHRRARPHLETNEVYAILTDPGLAHRWPTYFITADSQRRQLAEAGFETERVLDEDGRDVAAGARSGDPWLHYLARRGANAQPRRNERAAAARRP